MFTNPQDILNKFNDFFVNTGPEVASNIHNTGKNSDYLIDVNPSSTNLKPIVEMDIVKIIDKFISNKGAGNNNIGNFIINRVPNEIVKSFTIIFNLSTSTGIVPEKLKVAKVVPTWPNI